MKISLRKIVSILFILTCILGMTVEIKYVDNINIPYWLVYLSIVMSCGLGIMFEFRGNINKKALWGLGFLILYLLFYIIVSRYNVFRFLTAFALFIVLFYIYSYLLQRHSAFEDFIYIYADVVLLIGAISIFFWLFGSVLNVLPGRMSTTYSFAKWAHLKTYTYYYLYFENPIQNQRLLGITVPRNCGVFTEAPAFAGILLYALGIHVFGPRKIDKIKTLALVVILLSTQSTKALIILIIIFGIKIIMEGNEGKSQVYKFFKAVASLITVVITSIVLNAIVSDKMVANESFLARMNHLTGGLRTWLQHPFFGAGFENDDAFFMNLRSGAGENGLSMGLTVLLAYGGIYLTLFYFFAVLSGRQNIHSRKNQRNYFYFILMLLVNVFISNSAFGYPYLFFVASGYAAGAQSNEITRKRIT